MTVVVVRHNVRQSYISRTVWTRITKCYTNLHIGQFYNHTRYDITIYIRPEVIDVRKTAENYACDGFNLDSPKLPRTSIPMNWTAIPDMTLLTTSGWQLSKLKKTSKMPPPTSFSGVVFCLPQQLVSVLFLFLRLTNLTYIFIFHCSLPSGTWVGIDSSYTSSVAHNFVSSCLFASLSYLI